MATDLTFSIPCSFKKPTAPKNMAIDCVCNTGFSDHLAKIFLNEFSNGSLKVGIILQVFQMAFL
jgi:hypothetical protein